MLLVFHIKSNKQQQQQQELCICQDSIWKTESGDLISQALERLRSQQRRPKQPRD